MLWRFCIDRPVFTTVVFLVISIFGGYALNAIPVRENPDVDFPIVSVNVVLSGAEPAVVETEVVEPLEEQINTVEGIKELTSTAREEVAEITVEFELWRDIDVAAQDVRDRIDRARRELPDDVEAPIVRKLDPDAQPIMWIALTGDERWGPVRLTTFADEFLKERLENLRGVGQIRVGGASVYAIRVQLDPAKLAAHRLTVQDVVETIRSENVKIPSGRIESRNREFLVNTEGRFAGPGPMNELIVAERDGKPVRIADVGKVVADEENQRQLARFQGKLAVGVGVVKQRDANTVTLAAAVRDRMTQLAREFPAGLAYTIATDNSDYIEESVADLLFTVVLTTLLVVVVVLLFLGTVRGTLVTSAAIPISLLGGLTMIYLFDFSLNVLSLLGFILAIGIVIDDAVVVLEASYRKMQGGQDAREASQEGTSEVAFPNIANTLSLAAVFLPVAFTAGLIGRFFFEFSVTVVVTVALSTITAITLTPTLCAQFVKVKQSTGGVARWSMHLLERAEGAYGRIVDRLVRRPVMPLTVAVLIMALNAFFFMGLSTEFLPSIDRSEFIVRFETPEGSTLDYMHAYAERIQAAIMSTPEIKHHFLALGLSRGAGPGRVNQGLAFVRLVPRAERTRHQSDVIQALRERMAQIPGGRAFVMETSGVAGAPGEAELQMVLQHDSLERLAEVQAEVMQWMRKQREFVDVNSDLKVNKPEVRVAIQRDRAAQLGLSVAEISNTMRYLLGEPDIAEIERSAERYEVIPEIIGKGRMIPTDLAELYLRADNGAMVAMDNVVNVRETVGPSAIHHYNRLRGATISASTPPGVALGDALSGLRRYLQQHLPGSFSFAVTGRAQDFKEAFYYLSIALVFAVIFMYLVLAAQFESFIQPFIILIALPLAGTGALGALWALDMTLNIYSFIGLIMLLGMATKNGILMVDQSNTLAAEEGDIATAATRAARIRFRPVIMTTVSTVFGLLPIALGFGAGGEARAPLGVAVSAGLLVTTIMTLLILPALYTVIRRPHAGTAS